MSLFQKASRKRVFLKIGLMGASGSGKTRSALELAKGLAQGGPVAVIDTENGSASLYSHVAEFDVADLEPPFDPEKYIQAIRAAEEAGYKVLVIDSFTHAWKYLLNKKEGLDARGGRQNQYTNWGPVKAEADRLKDAILQSRLHILCCMRSKTEYAQEGGKVTKVGLAAVQEPDVEYEFTTVFQIDTAHNAQQTKDRTGLFGDRVFRIDAKTGQTFLNWLDSADSQEYQAAPAPVPTATLSPGAAFVAELKPKKSDVERFKAACSSAGREWKEVAEAARNDGVETVEALVEYARALGGPSA